MAEYDDLAFDSMNGVSPDYDIGGAIQDRSRYSYEMSYEEREDFHNKVLNILQLVHYKDPHRKNLGFKDWLGNVNWNLQEELFKGWDDFMNMSKAKKREFFKSNTEDSRNLLQRFRDAGELRQLADLHTGRLEDLADIARTSEHYYDNQKSKGGQ